MAITLRIILNLSMRFNEESLMIAPGTMGAQVQFSDCKHRERGGKFGSSGLGSLKGVKLPEILIGQCKC